jgi:hypothetical protein
MLSRSDETFINIASNEAEKTKPLLILPAMKLKNHHYL